ncbi:MAG: G1 family glutamic endopeptidase [Solirubrobacteraceae bacterium]
MTSVQGSWTVPAIRRGSRKGAFASTWIGAAAPPGDAGPFIQIGTQDWNMSAADSVGYLGLTSYDGAFWSDNVHHFHPQFLFTVYPGDRMSASLSLKGGRWRLSIVNRTLGESAHFSTSQEADAAFNEAEWLQEDPGGTKKPVPYPRLSTVSFSRLAVNSAAPRYADLYSGWMSEDGTNWAPTPLRNDSFRLQRASVSAAGAQYLRIIKPMDAASRKFFGLAGAWTARTPRKQIAAETSTYAAVLRNTSSALRRSAWPSSVRQLVGLLAADQLANASRWRAMTSLAPSRRAAAVSKLLPVYGNPDNHGHLVRRALHIPEITPQS